ncbi:MAG: CAP domain-containing protein, partial [Verrucomicrobiales bacterium]
MKRSSQIRGLGAGLALLFASCASSIDTTRISMAKSVEGRSSHQVEELHAALNDFRRSIGEDPLPRHRGLDRMAQEHCEFMAKNQGKFSLGSENISHYGFESRVLMAQRAYQMDSVSENVAGGAIQGNVAETLVKSWTKSKKHSY